MHYMIMFKSLKYLSLRINNVNPTPYTVRKHDSLKIILIISHTSLYQVSQKHNAMYI